MSCLSYLIFICILRWPTSVTAKEKSSRQKKNACGKKEIGHGKRKNLPAKEKIPRQKKNACGKKEIGHGKRKNLLAKGKLPRQKRNSRGKIKYNVGKKKKQAAKENSSLHSHGNSQQTFLSNDDTNYTLCRRVFARTD